MSSVGSECSATGQLGLNSRPAAITADVRSMGAHKVCALLAMLACHLILARQRIAAREGVRIIKQFADDLDLAHSE